MCVSSLQRAWPSLASKAGCINREGSTRTGNSATSSSPQGSLPITRVEGLVECCVCSLQECTYPLSSTPQGKLQGEVKLKNMQVFFPGTGETLPISCMPHTHTLPTHPYPHPFTPPTCAGEREQSYQFTVHTESSWNKRK